MTKCVSLFVLSTSLVVNQVYDIRIRLNPSNFSSFIIKKMVPDLGTELI